jgi:exosortase H (IPTLxxWG-CTERM-specific)
MPIQHKPGKKRKKQAEVKPTAGKIIRDGWSQKLPVLLFVTGFAVLMILFYLFWLSDFSQEKVQPVIVSVNARVSGFILNLFGMGTTSSGGMISSPRFSVSIARGCDAIEAMALFATALITFPARWKYKLTGLLTGIALLFSLNILRIVSLFLTGIWFPSAFEMMHVEVWQVVFIVFAIALWIFWIRWARTEKTRVQP